MAITNKLITKTLFTIFIVVFLIFSLFGCDNITTQYTLTLIYGQNETETYEYLENTKIQSPNSIEIEGYQFVDWYLSQSFEVNPIEFPYTIISDTIFYAKYDDVRININFIVDNDILHTIKIPSGSVLSEPIHQIEGCTLEGWYTSDDDGITLLDKWFFQNDIANGSFNLYANVIPNEYEITLNSLNGSVLETSLVNYNEQVPTPYIPTREGYEFQGWYTSLNFDEPFTPINMPAHNIELYAKWEPNTHQVRYVVATQGLFQNVNLDDQESVIKSELGRDFGVALTTQGRVVTWGQNTSGQLGIGTTRDSGPSDITQYFNLQVNEKIIDISTGDSHVLALADSGRIFSWGYNSLGMLGNGQIVSEKYPIDITNQFSLTDDEKIISIQASLTGSSAMTSSYQLYIWGSNGKGQIGNGTTVSSSVPINITDYISLEEGEFINYVSLGWYHTGIITSEHRVFMWGNNQNGQLGNGSTESSLLPVEITNHFELEVLDYIEKLSLGNDMSSAVSHQGIVSTWGSGFYRALGLSNIEYFQLGYSIKEPFNITDRIPLENDDIITDISIGYEHTLMISRDGSIFGMGRNTWGALGNSGSDEFIYDPISLSVDANLEHIKIVQTDSYFYSTIMLGENGLIYVLGYNYNLSDLNLSYVAPQTTRTPVVINKRIAIIIENAKYEELIDFSLSAKDGYSFSGWFTDKNYTIANNLYIMPNNDITIYGYLYLIDTANGID